MSDKANNPWGEFVEDLMSSVHKQDGKSAPKVLVVDDSNVVRQELRSILAGRRCEVLEAVDGVDGLAKIAANPGIALVFCDVNMPNMNGIEMVEKVAADAAASRKKLTPIIMLTTESTKEKVVRAKGAGVLGWIIKPAKREHILQLFDRFVDAKAAA